MTEPSWEIDAITRYPKGNNPFGNRFYGYSTNQVRLPDEGQATYFGVDIGSCVHTVALAPDETTYLVRQPRPNTAQQLGSVPVTLELPGGFAPIPPGLSEAEVLERLKATANQELREEIGRRALHQERLVQIYPSPGISNEIDHVFVGTGLVNVGSGLAAEATEQDLRVVPMKLGDALKKLLRGNVPVSGQAVTGLIAAKEWLERQ